MMMRRTALFVPLLALLALPVAAQTCPGVTGPVTPYGREVITVSNTAIGFTAANYADGGGEVRFAQVTLETNNIRVSTDGLAPTAAVGELWQTSTNVKFFVCGQTNVRQFKAIRTTADASLTVQYYR